jgi:hypothetical protein
MQCFVDVRRQLLQRGPALVTKTRLQWWQRATRLETQRSEQ